jgi:two-component system chemotaxis response regulator CheB
MPFRRNIVVIGASAGGVEALQHLVGKFPADLAASVFIVLHTWPSAKSYLGPILERAGPLRVVVPGNDDPIEPGTIYVAPTDQHMLLAPCRIIVERGPRENRARPAINPLFRTAAAAYGSQVIGVILTGMLDDGTAGLWAVKQCGGVAIVQDPNDALYGEMPRSAVDNVAVDHCVPLAQISNLINQLSRETVDAPAPNTPSKVLMSNLGAAMTLSADEMDQIGKRSTLTCPECHGALWEISEGGVPEYRCHVGHGYSPRTLADEQGLGIEQSLWSALRALKESAELDERLALRTRELELEKAAMAYERSATEKRQQADQLLSFLHSFRGPPEVESNAP